MPPIQEFAIEGQPMDNKNEILIAVREARRIQGDGADFRVAEVLTILESIAPFPGQGKRHRDEVQSSSLRTRRQLDIDYVQEWIAKKRKMDISYL